MRAPHTIGYDQVAGTHHRADLGVERVERLGGERHRVGRPGQRDPRFGLHEHEHREVPGVRVGPAAQLPQAVDEHLAVGALVDLLHVEDLEARRADRAPERSVGIGEHVELDLAHRLVLELLAQGRMRHREVGEARLDRGDDRERLGGRLDVVAVVRPDDLKVVSRTVPVVRSASPATDVVVVAVTVADRTIATVTSTRRAVAPCPPHPRNATRCSRSASPRLAPPHDVHQQGDDREDDEDDNQDFHHPSLSVLPANETAR